MKRSNSLCATTVTRINEYKNSLRVSKILERAEYQEKLAIRTAQHQVLDSIIENGKMINLLSRLIEHNNSRIQKPAAK